MQGCLDALGLRGVNSETSFLEQLLPIVAIVWLISCARE